MVSVENAAGKSRLAAPAKMPTAASIRISRPTPTTTVFSVGIRSAERKTVRSTRIPRTKPATRAAPKPSQYEPVAVLTAMAT